jgi:S-adenosylmethionine:tRNA ribosyltransferase-isomerase
MLPIEDYDYELPERLIAQAAVEPRDSARLMVVRRADRTIEHARFDQIGRYLRAGDLLVANESRVLPARLLGRKRTGGHVEALLLRRLDDRRWEALVRGRGLRVGAEVSFSAAADRPGPSCSAAVIESLEDGRRVLMFDRPIEPLLDQIGAVPLPPYIHQPVAPERYQTVYGRTPGSAAAPTAGLHFTERLIDELRAAGVGWATVTLHVSRDTFQPIQGADALRHSMHGEWFELPPAAAEQIGRARREGGRVVAVGTTSVRVLESAARQAGSDRDLAPLAGWTDIYIHPPYRFQAVDAMITNFHMPRSTPLLMTSAFAGRELLLAAYHEAIQAGYRFLSLGDATLLL